MPREAPPTNTIYTGMLAVSLAAVVVGCLVLALELTNDYDWTTEAKGGPPVTLPAKGSGPAGAAGGGGMAALGRQPIYLDEPVAAPIPAPAAPATKPATTPATVPPPAPIPAPVLVTPPAAKPADPPAQNETANKPPGLVPSSFKLPGGR